MEITERQIKFLRDLGYTKDVANLTSVEASDLIKKCKANKERAKQIAIHEEAKKVDNSALFPEKVIDYWVLVKQFEKKFGHKPSAEEIKQYVPKDVSISF